MPESTVLDFTEEQLRQSIADNLRLIAQYDKHAGIDPDTRDFKSMIELLKAIVKQNELILRQLKALKGQGQ